MYGYNERVDKRPARGESKYTRQAGRGVQPWKFDILTPPDQVVSIFAWRIGTF
jgi:hypothetical protein